MPHIHLKEYQEATLPCQIGMSRFLFRATNVNHRNEQLIAVEVEGKPFFILRKDEKKCLIKSDKITRPSPTYLIHTALLDYVSLTDAKVLSSNVHTAHKSIHFQETTALKPIEFFVTQFPQNDSMHIEVGFGSGRHLIHQALQHPNTTFIGIEIHRPSIEQVLKQISIQNIDNILLLDYDARLFMELIPSNSIEKIYVHFPVPWDKKPHRRVISKAFIEEAIRVLNVNGKLELRTDSENYYMYSYETFMGLRQLSLEIHKNRSIAVSSKYEDRWRLMEKNIYDLILINTEESPKRNAILHFKFPKKLCNSKRLEALNGTTVTFEEEFIHYERLYRIENDGMLLRLSFGNFKQPEHLYLIFRDDETIYFPQEPIATPTNYKVHQRLIKELHG